MSKNTRSPSSDARWSTHPVRKFDWQQEVLPNFDECKLEEAAKLGSGNTKICVIKLIGLVCSTYAGRDGGSVYPTVESVAHDASVSITVVRRARAALVHVGLLTFVAPSKGKRGTEYRLSQPAPVCSKAVMGDRPGVVTPVTRDRQTQSPVIANPSHTRLPSPVNCDRQPDQDQIRYQTTHQSAQKQAVDGVSPRQASSEVEELAAIAGCTPAEVSMMTIIADHDPTTKRSAIGRLLSDPGYRAESLRHVREAHERKGREQLQEIGRRLKKLPKHLAECEHNDPEGLAPTIAGEPRCPHCRHARHAAMTVPNLEELEATAAQAQVEPGETRLEDRFAEIAGVTPLGQAKWTSLSVIDPPF